MSRSSPAFAFPDCSEPPVLSAARELAGLIEADEVVSRARLNAVLSDEYERFGLVTIPESVRELHLFLDNDAGGDLAEERAREAYACAGRRIAAMRPITLDEDWNDVLMNGALAVT